MNIAFPYNNKLTARRLSSTRIYLQIMIPYSGIFIFFVICRLNPKWLCGIVNFFGVFLNSIYLCDIKQRNLMKTLSLKLDDSVFADTEQVISHIKKSRNRYINEALDYYNKVQKRKLLASKLEKESKLVKEDSMKVLHEFEMIDNES